MELMKRRFEFNKASHAQIALIERVYVLGEMFQDMLFRTGTIAAEFLSVRDEEDKIHYESIFDELEYFDYEFFNFRVASLKNNTTGSFNPRTLTLSIDKSFFEDTVILHEMIHLHECVLDKFVPAFFKEIYFLCLYNDLKQKISDLDEKILQCCHVTRSIDTFYRGGNHGVLFALKSFDLDLRTGNDIGTIFGYGRTDYLRGASGEEP